jgi:hypothetical protein
MGVAVYIAAEREVPGLDVSVNGKPLARSNLDRFRPTPEVRPLHDYFSISPEDAASIAGDDPDDVPPGRYPPEEWFAPEDGLATVRALLAYLAAHPDDRRNIPFVVDDLREFERVLTGLAAAGVRWHLAIDI